MRAGVRRQLLVMPTGAGKTATAAYMAGTSITRAVAPVWFVVHRRELMIQTARAFADAGIDVGMVARGYELHPSRSCQVVLLPSLAKRIQHVPAPRLIIPDEAHHCAADGYKTMLETFPRAWLCGLSATPERLDGKGLGAYFDRIEEGPSLRWLIDNGYLCDYKLFAPKSVSVEGVHTVAGDFNKAELHAALEKSTIVGDAVKEYRRHANGKRAIVRSLGIEDSVKVAEAFSAGGHAAVHIDGKTPEYERETKFAAFKRNEIQVLCNVDLFGEGVDVPGVDCVIDLRPTKSLTLHLQFIGRALRAVYAPGMPLDTAEQRKAAIAAGPKPYAIVIDHVGNVERHGLPDEEREWSLDGRTKRKPRGIWTCKHCFAAFATPQNPCPECGAMPEALAGAGRASPARVEGELAEVDKEKVRRKRVSYPDWQRHARTLEDLIRGAVEHGYKEGYARRIWEARQRKRGVAA